MANRDRSRGMFSGMGKKNLLVIAGISAIALALLIFLAATLSIELQLTDNGGTDPLT